MRVLVNKSYYDGDGEFDVVRYKVYEVTEGLEFVPVPLRLDIEKVKEFHGCDDFVWSASEKGYNQTLITKAINDPESEECKAARRLILKKNRLRTIYGYIRSKYSKELTAHFNGEIPQLSKTAQYDMDLYKALREKYGKPEDLNGEIERLFDTVTGERVIHHIGEDDVVMWFNIDKVL